MDRHDLTDTISETHGGGGRGHSAPAHPASPAPARKKKPLQLRPIEGLPFTQLKPGSPVDVEDLGATATTGPVLSFADTGGWANVAVDLSGVSSSAATVEAWISSSATPGGSGEVIYLGQDGDGAAPRLSVDAQSRIHVYWSSAGTGGGYASADTLPVLDGTWHHIAVTFDGGALSFFKDGQPTTEPTPVTMPAGVPATSAAQLGAGFGDAIGFVGQLFDVRFWSTARSAAQIQQLRYAAVDGTLSGQVGALAGQGLVMAVSLDPSRNAPVNLVTGQTGNLNDCTITTGPLPQSGPQITMGVFPSNLHGNWNVMTPSSVTRMQSVVGDSTNWAALVEDQMQLQGFFSSLQQSGDDGWGDATDQNGNPVKVAEWTDSSGTVHTIQNRAIVSVPVSSSAVSSSAVSGRKAGGHGGKGDGGSGHGGGGLTDPTPTGAGATAQLIYNTRNEATLIAQKVQTVSQWTGGALTLAVLLEKAVMKGLNSKLSTLKSSASDAKGLYDQEQLSDEAYDEALGAVVDMEKAIGVVDVIGSIGTGLAVLAGLVDGIFALFHPTTTSVSMWNETELDLEWSLTYLNDGSYWLNSDGQDQTTWRPFPAINTVTTDTSPIFGPITQETVAAVNLLFGNGKSGSPLAANDIDQCIAIREKNSDDEPYILLLSAPLTGANSMGMGQGAGDENYYTTTYPDTPMNATASYTFTIGGQSVEFNLTADAMNGQTTYAGFQGYNYNTLLYIKPSSS